MKGIFNTEACHKIVVLAAVYGVCDADLATGEYTSKGVEYAMWEGLLRLRLGTFYIV
jgi:hypothetical protein